MDCTPPASTGELAESGRCFVQMVNSEIIAESQRVEARGAAHTGRSRSQSACTMFVAVSAMTVASPPAEAVGIRRLPVCNCLAAI